MFLQMDEKQGDERMSKVCLNCGNKLDDDAKFCEKCGAKVNNSFWKRHKSALIIMILVFVVAGLLGYFVVYSNISNYLQSKENQKEADKVIAMIDSLNDEEITIDSGEKLEKIKDEYDSLTKEQKKLVTNYSNLKKAYEEFEAVKNQQIADQIIAAIDQIDPNNLTAEDTSVQELKDKYNSLSDAQKALVTNAGKLDEYGSLIQSKKDEEQEKQKKTDEILAMFANLQYYGGLWGDFGIHVNQYQGMVEAAIRSSISLSDYFGDVNGTGLSLEKVVDDRDVAVNGLTATNQKYVIMFEGPSIYGPPMDLYCTVSSPDGVNLVYTEESFDAVVF